MMYKIRFAISPCPNDTFIAYGLIHNKVLNNRFEIKVDYFDIEQLNNLALTKQADVIKVSTAIIPEIMNNYKILNSGAALGYNCGPLLISKSNKIQISNKIKIGLPGKLTTANRLFERYFGVENNVQYLLFSDIEDAILNDKIDAGVIIHENRFTYLEKGLTKICDLGELWYHETKLPIPLGCFVVLNDMPNGLKKEFDMLLKMSIKYSIENKNEAMTFVRKHSQTMSDEVAFKHIGLYVNNETISISKEGKMAILRFITNSESKNISTFDNLKMFI